MSQANETLTYDEHQEVESHTSTYLRVFAALLVFTILEYLYAMLVQAHFLALVLGLVALAVTKATLVAMFFMHLKGEKPMVFWPLALTAVLVVGLFVSVLFAEGDHLFGTKFGDACGTAPKAVPAAGAH